MRILVTGGSGFIGTNLVDYFAARGDDVISIDLAPPRDETQRARWRELDIRDRGAVLELFAANDFDAVVHMAARTDLRETVDLRGYSANIDGVLHLVEALRSARTVKRVLFASSRLVCEIGYQPTSDYDYRPTTLYGDSKVLGEKIVRASNLPCVWTIVRPTSIWGPWFGEPYRNFFDAIARNRFVHPRGRDITKSFGFVGNTVHQVGKLLQASAEDVAGKTFYLADPPLQLRAWAHVIQQRLGARPIREVPVELLRAAATVGDLAQRFTGRSAPITTFRLNNLMTPMPHDTRELERIVGPLPFTLERGVEITTDWLRRHG